MFSLESGKGKITNQISLEIKKKNICWKISGWNIPVRWTDAKFKIQDLEIK